MTHVQEIFIKNLRYYRNTAGFSQLAFSEKIGLSPNYLNAVENGKNFPSTEVIQKMIDALNIMPYQLFLEEPKSANQADSREMLQLANNLKKNLTTQIDNFIEKHL
ncbi:helix-turn-helix domain-containing protein [uncultured Treponema sp.]|uniref:helix-turn-helix domain-containing protein n=1 Tax=uncultured Treponema sp. TaxID=162155 RepID=UPI0025F6D6C8|nr:helix-turn-helix transcriptional regulator [uncultured Treponema sp.]